MTKEQLTVLTAKCLEGKATAEEKAILEQWYYSFDERELTVELPMGDEYELEDRMKARIDEMTARRSVRPFLKVIRRLRPAAVIFLVLTAGLLAVFFNSRQVYSAQQHPRFVTLEDGTEVWLNTATKLVYTDLPFLRERRLTLTGEAYFDVAREADKPFIIRSGNMTTQVLGTSFNIKCYPDEPFNVTVISGKIRLEDRKTKVVTVLTSNKQLKYSRHRPPVLAVVKPETAHAWTRGQLEFYDQSFGEIARTINRKYKVKVIFSNPALEQCMITASFEKESAVGRVVDLLCKINNATYTFSADSSAVTLDGKGCQ
jgi:ferric-dicitrate binding protein FerR (iron transport regulator)